MKFLGTETGGKRAFEIRASKPTDMAKKIAAIEVDLAEHGYLFERWTHESKSHWCGIARRAEKPAPAQRTLSGRKPSKPSSSSGGGF